MKDVTEFFCTGLPTYISPCIHSYLSFHWVRKTGYNDTERTPCNKIWVNPCFQPTLVINLSYFKYGYYHPSMYPVVPLGGATFIAMQVSKEELLTNIADIWWMVSDWALNNNTFRVVYLLLPTHVVVYRSLRLAPRCLSSTLVLDSHVLYCYWYFF